MASGFKGFRGRALSVRKAAELLECSEETVRRLIADRDLVAFRIRGSLRIWRTSLDQYVEEQIATPVDDEHLAERITRARRDRNRDLQSGRATGQLLLLEEA